MKKAAVKKSAPKKTTAKKAPAKKPVKKAIAKKILQSMDKISLLNKILQKCRQGKNP
ncbi:MAG: hypothetical protein ACK55I_08320 [bacterium]